MTERFQIQDFDLGELKAESKLLIQKLEMILDAVSIDEVGSTAVSGVIGKQDIDVAVRVTSARFNTSGGAINRC